MEFFVLLFAHLSTFELLHFFVVAKSGCSLKIKCLIAENSWATQIMIEFVKKKSDSYNQI